MVEPRAIAKVPRDQFDQTVESEFSKFEREERAPRLQEREERAVELPLPREVRRLLSER